MLQIKKNEATASKRLIPFRLFQTDHYTPNGNLSLTLGVNCNIYVSKNGGSHQGASGTVYMVGTTTNASLYYYEPTQGEVDTIGFLSITVVATTTPASDIANAMVQITEEDPYSTKDAEIDAIKVKTDKMLFDASNFIKANIQDQGILSIPTKEQIADQVWEEPMEDHAGYDLYVMLKRANVIIEPDISSILNIDNYPAETAIDMAFRIYANGSPRTISTSEVFTAGGFALGRIRNGVVTALVATAAEAWDSRGGIKVGKQIDLSTLDIQGGDVLIMIIDGLQFESTDARWGMQPTVLTHYINIIREDQINNNLIRALGLTHENIYISNTWDGEKHTGSTIEIYDSKENAELHDGSTGLISRYTLAVTYTGSKPTSQVMSKDDLGD